MDVVAESFSSSARALAQVVEVNVDKKLEKFQISIHQQIHDQCERLVKDGVTKMIEETLEKKIAALSENFSTLQKEQQGKLENYVKSEVGLSIDEQLNNMQKMLDTRLGMELQTHILKNEEQQKAFQDKIGIQINQVFSEKIQFQIGTQIERVMESTKAELQSSKAQMLSSKAELQAVDAKIQAITARNNDIEAKVEMLSMSNVDAKIQSIIARSKDLDAKVDRLSLSNIAAKLEPEIERISEEKIKASNMYLQQELQQGLTKENVEFAKLLKHEISELIQGREKKDLLHGLSASITTLEEGFKRLSDSKTEELAALRREIDSLVQGGGGGYHQEVFKNQVENIECDVSMHKNRVDAIENKLDEVLSRDRNANKSDGNGAPTIAGFQIWEEKARNILMSSVEERFALYQDQMDKIVNKKEDEIKTLFQQLTSSKKKELQDTALDIEGRFAPLLNQRLEALIQEVNTIRQEVTTRNEHPQILAIVERLQASGQKALGQLEGRMNLVEGRLKNMEQSLEEKLLAIKNGTLMAGIEATGSRGRNGNGNTKGETSPATKDEISQQIRAEVRAEFESRGSIQAAQGMQPGMQGTIHPQPGFEKITQVMTTYNAYRPSPQMPGTTPYMYNMGEQVPPQIPATQPNIPAIANNPALSDSQYLANLYQKLDDSSPKNYQNVTQQQQNQYQQQMQQRYHQGNQPNPLAQQLDQIQDSDRQNALEKRGGKEEDQGCAMQ